MKLGRILPASFLAAALAGPASGQNVFYQESFNTGTPNAVPTGWTLIQLGYLGDIWQWVPNAPVNGSGAAYHEWFCDFGLFFRDNILLSPPIDLRGFTNAAFRCDQVQQLPLARYFNGVKVTTNNGASYTLIYQETGTWSGFGTIQAGLDAFAGQPNVRLAFHYQGAVANDWWVDNVQVTTTNPIYSVSSLIAGQTATFGVAGATPGNPVLIGVSPGPGPILSPWGNINMSQPIYVLASVLPGFNGQLGLIYGIPPGTQGITVYTQAGAIRPDLTVNLTNSLVRTIL